MSVEAPAKSPAKTRRANPLLLALPVIAIALLIGALVKLGPAGIFPGEFPPVEELTFGRVTLKPNKIVAVVTNGGPSPVTVSQVLVDEAYWEHTIEPDREVRRLESSTITVDYPWVEGEPVEIVVITSTGVTFSHAIDVATSTPGVDARFVLTFALLGIYIGLLPVLLGMGFMPFLRTLSGTWITFFMAFTAGVLIFLGIETIAEALEGSAELPGAVGGPGLVGFAAIASFAVIFAGSRWLKRKSGRDKRLVTAYLVAAGIGLHNLGEGLAVGAAYRVGQIALGAFLVIGFALHNTTEGIGIVALLGERRTRIATLALLGVIAGAPTIIGAWIGGFFFSPSLAAIFLAIAAGAIAEVVVDVLSVVREDSKEGISSPAALIGIATGLAVMYATGVFIAA